MKLILSIVLASSISSAGYVNEAIKSGPAWKFLTVKNDEKERSQETKDMLPLGNGAFCLFASSDNKDGSIGILDCYSATEDKKRSTVRCTKPGNLRRLSKEVPPELLEVQAGKDVYLVGIYCQ